jgi:two-component system, NtrC family, response regulator GlrR
MRPRAVSRQRRVTYARRVTVTFEIVGAGDAARLEISAMTLAIVAGPHTGARYAATAERFTIGTSDQADLVIRDRSVSRFHAEVWIDNGRAAIRDLGSTNGTFVDGVAIVHAYLAPGQTIRAGATELRFGTDGPPVTVAVGAAATADRFGPLVGRSPAMRAVFARLARAAASDATVLLTGETGTGKEAAAEALHGASRRAGAPFVIVDCAAIPPDLLESELFGHERGAFTGAIAARAGAFEAADGGTVFLDELGELSPALQPKLLRALERREIKRVGATAYKPVDVRIVAATNRDLRAEVNTGRFREDLYYRVAVVEVRLPPLRERVDDVPLLVEELLARAGMADRPETALLRSPEGKAELARHPFPGNVRELRNYVERCLALAERPAPPEAPRPSPDTGTGTGAGEDLRSARKRVAGDYERAYLEDLLARHGGNVSAAAREAGFDRKHFYRLLWRHGLR